MIIRKKDFKFNKKFRHCWPFTCNEISVAISAVMENKKMVNAISILHRFEIYAVSDVLIKMGVRPIMEADFLIYTTRINSNKRSVRCCKDMTMFINFVVNKFHQVINESNNTTSDIENKEIN